MLPSGLSVLQVSLDILTHLSHCFQLIAQYVWLIPVLAILIIGPAAALLVRVMQLEPCTTTYIANWGSTEWILFLSFLNNFRYLVSQPDLMSRLGGHLLKSKVCLSDASSEVLLDGNQTSVPLSASIS